MTTPKQRDFLEAEQALAKLLALYDFWGADERCLKEALKIIQMEG